MKTIKVNWTAKENKEFVGFILFAIWLLLVIYVASKLSASAARAINKTIYKHKADSIKADNNFNSIAATF